MAVKLYGTPPSHPSHAARLMLERKGIDHKLIWLLPGLWPIMVRTRGFRGSTVPALKLDGQRIQHSREISRALEQYKADPPLFPRDPKRRIEVEEAERWGEEVLQPVPRRIIRWLALHRPAVRTAIAREAGMPAPGVAARLNAPMVHYLARKSDSSDERVKSTIRLLPALIDHVDRLIADGVIGGKEPNAADYQIATTVRSLLTLEDLAPAIEGTRAEWLARAILPEIGSPPIPPSLPAEWLAPLAGQR
ncbi:MAG: glutathione S-transferase family protein [Solirubrobacterales bacterium]